MKLDYIEEHYDVIVVGAGHAGCEAALACARLSLSTIIFTVAMDAVAFMPCNPHIGGSSKGHLVREIDALGGEMGKNIDRTYLQFKMLNMSKGPAVHSPRAQADKQLYSLEMRKVLQNTDNLTLRQAEVSEIIVNDNKICGVKTLSGANYYAKAVILCTGTYLNARCLFGEVIDYTGPNGLKAATHLTASLKENGVVMRRFKTGTPARVDGRSIDYSMLTPQYGDEKVRPFSFSTDPDSLTRPQYPCYLTYTNEKTHEIIRDNLDRSPIYAGIIEGTGPRYCPSIEDKVVKFSDKDRHQLFLEPESIFTNEIYIDGLSSSLPEEVQHAVIHSIKGLENAKVVRNAYAIEYDCISGDQLQLSLEFKNIKGLFSGGQFNGSSGYEEAAAQGLIAGINAAMEILGREPLILDRSTSYIGVLIDDLVTKEQVEPYRMMTSRAEYRLLLRQDNADLRLTSFGHDVGLVSDERYEFVENKKKEIVAEIERVGMVMVNPTVKNNDLLKSLCSAEIVNQCSLSDLIRRPELDYEKVIIFDEGRPYHLSDEVKEQVNIDIKYEGYIKRQEVQVERFKKAEGRRIPDDIDYEKVPSLRIESRQKLSKFRPVNIAQASRIGGVSPADISVLLIYLKSGKHKKHDE